LPNASSPISVRPMRVCLIKFANHATKNLSNYKLVELWTCRTTLTLLNLTNQPPKSCFPLIYPNQPSLLTNRAFIANLNWPNQPPKHVSPFLTLPGMFLPHLSPFLTLWELCCPFLHFFGQNTDKGCCEKNVKMARANVISLLWLNQERYQYWTSYSKKKTFFTYQTRKKRAVKKGTSISNRPNQTCRHSSKVINLYHEGKG